MRYQAVIDPKNKNNSHSVTIDFVEEASCGQPLAILDVGCSSGYLGEYLIAQGHHVTGIDITPEAIEKAAAILNETHCMLVEDFYKQHPQRRFDIVIFGDVLEHITNAQEVLTLTAQVLKPHGRVIASIPNVGHLAVRALLLEGRWEYANLGLLDRDHVRFFTRQTIEELFSHSGYDVNEMRTTKLSVETVDEMCAMRLNPRFVELARKAAQDDPSATVFQYVAMAQLKSEAPRIVCLVPAMGTGLFNFRVKNPLENWARRYGGAVRFRLIDEQQPEDLLWGDVFLFERMGGAYTIHLIQVLKKFGKRVVFEIDDLLTELPDFLAHHRGSPETLQSLRDAITLADVVTTTTSRLAARLTPLNPHVVCVPNCLKVMPDIHGEHPKVASANPVASASARTSASPDLIASLIVASSDTVLVDCLIEPLRFIQQQYGPQVQLVMVGPIERSLKKAGLSFKPAPIMPYPEFIDFLHTLVNPIGLIPLDDSVFSSCKSPIKFFDYASAYIPAICSNVPPYSDYVNHQKTGLLVDQTPSAWIEAIEMLIHSPEQRLNLAQAARHEIKTQYMTDKAGDAWQTVIDMLAINRKTSHPFSMADLVQEASLMGVKPNLNWKWLVKKALQRQTYIRLGTVLRQEGITGVRKRIVKW
ncbi:methyltransferase domain-containing protein [Zwartia sp.]|uniref:methyltransferase domain-containing protein n=1 Tax=Zwartia sp. TaxID=2978004 RepID=UPI00271DFC51|nr:methyltransferase domain-containing protein [Zwartia sp.]MDO9024816.1 methyltransferase domain-containing protein [Zwartia sp.]